ncbi:hypothetical protein QQF64_014248 [Cirrhinus molitorella]|uniref:Uncharacterized protein n=1 Tax=Cirrhinus molitorella TaxID=172907 RepID=A0ABR3MW40_9TELE
MREGRTESGSNGDIGFDTFPGNDKVCGPCRPEYHLLLTSVREDKSSERIHRGRRRPRGKEELLSAECALDSFQEPSRLWSYGPDPTDIVNTDALLTMVNNIAANVLGGHPETTAGAGNSSTEGLNMTEVFFPAESIHTAASSGYVTQIQNEPALVHVLQSPDFALYTDVIS